VWDCFKNVAAPPQSPNGYKSIGRGLLKIAHGSHGICTAVSGGLPEMGTPYPEAHKRHGITNGDIPSRFLWPQTAGYKFKAIKRAK